MQSSTRKAVKKRRLVLFAYMYILPFLLASYCAEWVVYAWTVNYLFCQYREEFTSKSNQYVLGRVAKEVKSLQPETLPPLPPDHQTMS